MLVPNNITGTLDYIGYNGQLLWQYQSSGGVVSDFNLYDKTLMDSAYYKNANVFLIAKLTNVDFSTKTFSF